MVRVFGRRVPGSGSEGRVCSGRVEAEQSASLLFLYISLSSSSLPPFLSLPFFVSSTIHIHQLSLRYSFARPLIST